MSITLEHLSRPTTADLTCAWTASPQAAWIIAVGTIDDSTVNRLADALRATDDSAIRVVDLEAVDVGWDGIAVTLAVLRSPRVVLKDPPDGLLSLLSPAEVCAVG